MSTFKVTGRVTFISDVEQFGAGKQSKRIIVCTEGNYPNYFPVTFYGDKMEAISGWNVGDFVEIDTYPGGRLKKGDDTQAFAYLNGWAAMKLHGDAPQAPQATQPAAQPAAQSKPTQKTAFDDVPF